MTDIRGAIRKIAESGKHPAAMIGKAREIDKERGRCKVDFEAAAPAVDARLEMEAGNGIMVVPKEGSDVVVVWVNEVLPVVVNASEVEEVVIRGGGNGGLINIQALVDKLNELTDAFNSHTHTVTTTGTASAQNGTAAATTGTAQRIEAAEIEDEKIRH